MKRHQGYGICILLLLAVTPSLALANEVFSAAFASTPFSTPHGYEWVLLVFVLLFVAANSLLLHKKWKITTRQAVKITGMVGVGITLLGFFVIPLQYEWFVRSLNLGQPAFFGWDWARSRTDFLWTNGLTLALVITGSCCLAYYYPRAKSSAIPPIVWICASLALLYYFMAPLLIEFT